MTLSYGSQFGYYGLRLNPTLEQVIGSIRKPLRIPLPDRRAKWYALSPYRALILDAEREANDYETTAMGYRKSGAQLPEVAAAIRPSDAGEDQCFRRIDEHHRAIDLQSAYETACQTMDQERKGSTKQRRKEVLRWLRLTIARSRSLACRTTCRAFVSSRSPPSTPLHSSSM